MRALLTQWWAIESTDDSQCPCTFETWHQIRKGIAISERACLYTMNELWTNIGHLGVKQQGLPNLQDKIYMFWPLLERLYDNCRNATMVKSVWSKPMISIRQLRATVNIMHLYAGVAPVILDLISSHYQVQGKCIYLPPLCETDVRQILYTIHQYVIHIWWGSPCYFGLIITSWPHSQGFVNFILQVPNAQRPGNEAICTFSCILWLAEV